MTYFILSEQGVIILDTMKLIPVGLLLLLLFKTEAGLTTCVMNKRVSGHENAKETCPFLSKDKLLLILVSCRRYPFKLANTHSTFILKIEHFLQHVQFERF